MSDDVEKLIATLSSDLAPVKRLRPAWLRATLWLLLFAALAITGVNHYADLPELRSRLVETPLRLEMVGSFATGIAAMLTAFALSVPGHAPAWRLLPLPPLLVWLAGSLSSCLRHAGPVGWQLGDSPECFVFIATAGGIALLFVFWGLRHGAPLNPRPVALYATLGCAAIAAGLLQFFHPFAIGPTDALLHFAAVAMLLLAAGIGGSRVLMPAR